MEQDQKISQPEQPIAESAPKFDAQEEARKRRLIKEEPQASAKEQDSITDDEKEPKVSNPEKKQVTEKETSDFSAELEKLKKQNNEARSYSSNIYHLLSKAKSKLTDLIDSGDLEEEVGKSILETLNAKSIKEPDDLKEKLKKAKGEEPQGILSPVLKVITPDLLNQYIEVVDDVDVSDKVRAFDALVAQSSEEEQQVLLQRINQKGQTPMSHLKSMLEIGQEFLEEGFSDYLKAGSFKKYTGSWKEKQTELEQKIDKLQKKVREYESNFDRPTDMNLGGSITGGGPTNRPFDGQEEARKRREALQRTPY